MVKYFFAIMGEFPPAKSSDEISGRTRKILFRKMSKGY